MKAQVETLLTDALAERSDLFLIDWNIDSENHIKIIIDGDEGVRVQDCIDISRALEHNLDREALDFSIEVLLDSEVDGRHPSFTQDLLNSVTRNLWKFTHSSLQTYFLFPLRL